MQKSTKKNTKRVAIVGATTGALLGGGVAFAYWTTSGGGTGTAGTAAGESNKLAFAQNTLKNMYPGDSSQDLTVTVTNNGTSTAYVAGVKAYLTTDKVGCTGSDYTLGGATAPSTADTAADLRWTAADLAVGSSADATSTIQFNDTDANQNACQGATVTINYIAQ